MAAICSMASCASGGICFGLALACFRFRREVDDHGPFAVFAPTETLPRMSGRRARMCEFHGRSRASDRVQRATRCVEDGMVALMNITNAVLPFTCHAVRCMLERAAPAAGALRQVPDGASGDSWSGSSARPGPDVWMAVRRERLRCGDVAMCHLRRCRRFCRVFPPAGSASAKRKRCPTIVTTEVSGAVSVFALTAPTAQRGDAGSGDAVLGADEGVRARLDVRCRGLVRGERCGQSVAQVAK